MKMNRLFVFAMAALSLTACSKDDSPSNGEGNGNGEIIDAISVRVVNSGSAYTRANVAQGEGSENDVYNAFIFAKEANPGHPGALSGDWTVKQITGAGANPIGTGNGGQDNTLANMCTFNNVRQGDNVYVIANDPNLTIERAEVDLAHKGEASEAAIKAYVSAVTKDYLNGLTVKVGATPAGKFIMAGMATIPTNPTIANGENIIVPVALDRELAKVKFAAAVTADAANEAAGKVKIETASGKEDGIIVVRIPRKVSYFTQMDRDWYFPAMAADGDKDWNIGTWQSPFHGDSEATPGAAVTPYFNGKTFNDVAKEYRMTWQLKNGGLTGAGVLMTFQDKNSPANPIQNLSTMVAPIFYTTPNYSDNAGCATVICTQATIAKDLLTNNLTATLPLQALFDKLYANIPLADNVSFTTGNNFGTFITYLKNTANDVNTDNNIKAALNEIYSLNGNDTEINARLTALKTAVGAIAATNATKADYLRYAENDKVYYRADAAEYTNDGVSVKNTMRNTYYEIRGTITSIGAPNIEDAVNSDAIGMSIQVSVKPWTMIVSNIPL